MCEDFVPKFGDKRTGSCITTMHRVTLSHFFHQGIFDQKQHDCRQLPTLLFSIPPIEDKTEICHFDTTEVIEARITGGVLITLREHDFQDAFKKWQKHWERCI
jgi:hypothetical protein